MRKLQYIIFIFLFYSCSSQTKKFNDYLTGYTDISPDKKNILISYYKDYVASIYEITIEGELLKKLTHASENNNHLRPQYSPNGEKILFIKSRKTTTHLMLMNRDGNNLREIPLPDIDVHEAIFHPDNKRIFLIPGIKSLSDGDNIYSVNYDGSNFQKITNIENGQIKNLKFIENGEKVIFTYDDFKLNSNKPDGIYSIKLSSPNRLILEINTQSTENSKLPVDVTYQQIAISPNNTLACESIYGNIHFFVKENDEWVKTRKEIKRDNIIFALHFLNENEVLYTEHIIKQDKQRENVLTILELNTGAKKSINIKI